MTSPKQDSHNHWKISAITEALGDLELTIEDKLSVGRGADNDLVLGSKQVSRHHAELSVENGNLQLTDLGSSNGSFINDTKVTPNDPEVVSSDDVISFAVFKFQVSKALPADSAPVINTVDNAATESIATEQTGVLTKALKQDSAPSDDKPSQQLTSSQPSTVVNTTPLPTKIENVDIANEAELEEQLEAELEEPISIGDPNQSAPVASEIEHHDAGESTHFETLASEADPDVHKAKQAATSQLSATANSVEEQEQHPVAHVKHSQVSQQSANTNKGGSMLLWVVLILLVLAVAVWLFNSGALA